MGNAQKIGALLLFLSTAACSPKGPKATSDGWQSQPTRTRVLVVLPDGSTQHEYRELKQEQFLDSYLQGDDDGVLLAMDLKPNGAFECSWTGFLGIYGKAVGTWLIDRDGLKLSAETSEGLFAHRPLGRLRVVLFQEHYLLVQEKDWKAFEDHRPDSFLSFHTLNARKLLQPAWVRRVDKKDE